MVIRNSSDPPAELISICTDVLNWGLGARGTIFPKSWISILQEKVSKIYLIHSLRVKRQSELDSRNLSEEAAEYFFSCQLSVTCSLNSCFEWSQDVKRPKCWTKCWLYVILRPEKVKKSQGKSMRKMHF